MIAPQKPRVISMGNRNDSCRQTCSKPFQTLGVKLLRKSEPAGGGTLQAAHGTQEDEVETSTPLPAGGAGEETSTQKTLAAEQGTREELLFLVF